LLRRLPYWPRLLSRDQAAAYCGVSANHFAAHCPLTPITIGARKLWDRHQLDQWLDTLLGPRAAKDRAGEPDWLGMLPNGGDSREARP